jgi:hypothetical protein
MNLSHLFLGALMKYTRLLFLAVSTLALLISACSQTDDLTAPTLEPQFGTRNHDSVEDVAYGKAGYLYAVGFWDSGYDPREFNGYHEVYQFSEQDVDAYLRRYDRSGNLVWENFFDIEPAYSDADRHQLVARAVAVDASGNAIVAWSADYLEYMYQDDYAYYERVAGFNYLAKYSPSGKRLWRVYTNNKRIRDLALDSSGNVYAISQGALTKYSSSGTQAWERFSNVTPTGVAVSSTNNIYVVRENGAVIKYNSSGTQLYAKTSVLDGYNYFGYKIAAGLNDEIYITAPYLYDQTTVTDESCNLSDTLTYKYYARLYKLSSMGTRQWFKNAANMGYRYNNCEGFYGWAPGYGLNVAADNLGNAYVATGASNLDAIVTKHSRSGSLLWSKGFGSGAPLDGATSVATYDGSEVFVGAVTYGGLAHRRLGGSDAVLREMNSSGAQVWTR